MSEHPNATVVREMNEAMASGDMEGAARRLADNVVWHEIGRAEPVRGKAALEASMGDFAGYDIKWDVHDVTASDDHVIALGTAVASKDGRSLTYRTAEIYHVKDGQVTQLKVALDKFERQAALLRQQKQDVEQAIEELTRTIAVIGGMLRDREAAGGAEAVAEAAE